MTIQTGNEIIEYNVNVIMNLIFVNCLTTCSFDLYCSMRCVIVPLKQYDDDDKVDKHHYYNQGCIEYSQRT